MGNDGLIARTQGNGNGAMVRQQAESTITALGERLKDALPRHMGLARFQKLALAMLTNQGVADCTRESQLKAILEVASSGLEPGRRVYIVPFKNRGRLTATVVYDYRGLMELAYRSGMCAHIDAHVIYANEDFDVEYGSNPTLRHTPMWNGDPGKAIGAYCVAKMKGAEHPIFAVLGPKHPRVLKAVRDTPLWKDTPEMGWLKTAVKVVCNLLPQSPEYMAAVMGPGEADEPEVVAGSGYEFIDADPVTGEVTDLPNRDHEPGAPAPRRTKPADEPKAEPPKPEPERDPVTNEIIPDHVGRGQREPGQEG